jgi:pimeloyl-ACP methyl ester carboxylesterase
MRATGGALARLPNKAFGALFTQFILRGHDSKVRAAESAVEHWRSYSEQDAAASFVRQIRALRTEDTLNVAASLPALRLPARVVWGAADRFQKVRYGERLARDLGTTLQRIAGGKHFTPEDHPDVIAGAVNDVLREIESQQAA